MNFTPRVRLRVLPALLPSDAPPVELQLDEDTGYIQWRTVGDADWIDLVPLSAIQGEPGIPGEGVPEGGEVGQVLQKAGAADFDYEWVTPAGGVSVLAFMTEEQRADVIAGTTLVNVAGAINDAVAAVPHVVLPAYRMLVSSAINVVDGVTIESQNSTLVAGSSAINMISAVSKENFRLIGVFNFEGSYNDGDALDASGNRNPSAQNGLYLDSCRNFSIDKVFAQDLRGAAVKVVPTAGNWTGITYGKRGGIDHIQATNCEYGMDLTASATIASQYIIWSRLDLVRNHIGLQLAAGNQVMSGGNVNGNDIGFNLLAGAGHLHGITSGFNINHNLMSIVAANITEGHTFANCHIYEGDMEFDACDGIVFEGGLLDVTTISYLNASPTAGRVRFRNMMLLDGYGPRVITGNVNGNIIMTNCFGVGAVANVNRSMDGEFACLAFRAPASTQSVSSGVAATVILPTEQIDNGGAYDASTGIFTCPEAGVYEASWNIMASGTAMSATASTLVLQTSTTATPSTFSDYTLSLPKIFGTTKLNFEGTTRVTMQKGAGIRLEALITGTTPVIGDPTYYCILTVRKVA